MMPFSVEEQKYTFVQLEVQTHLCEHTISAAAIQAADEFQH